MDPFWTLGQQIGPKRVGDELGRIGFFWGLLRGMDRGDDCEVNDDNISGYLIIWIEQIVEARVRVLWTPFGH